MVITATAPCTTPWGLTPAAPAVTLLYCAVVCLMLLPRTDQVEELEQQLSDKEAQVLQLSASVVDASQRQERLQAKLADARRK